MEQIINESIGSQVGIFWIVKEKIVSFMGPISNLSPDSLGFVNPPLDHDIVWSKVILEYPDLKDMEYFDIPRGRINYNIKDKKFRVLSSKEILTKNFLVHRLAREFHIPPKLLLLVADEHYELL